MTRRATTPNPVTPRTYPQARDYTRKESELVDLDVRVLRETERAVLVRSGDAPGDGLTVWLPLAHAVMAPCDEDPRLHTVTLPRWLAEEKGLV